MVVLLKQMSTVNPGDLHLYTSTLIIQAIRCFILPEICKPSGLSWLKTLGPLG